MKFNFKSVDSFFESTNILDVNGIRDSFEKAEEYHSYLTLESYLEKHNINFSELSISVYNILKVKFNSQKNSFYTSLRAKCRKLATSYPIWKDYFSEYDKDDIFEVLRCIIIDNNLNCIDSFNLYFNTYKELYIVSQKI